MLIRKDLQLLPGYDGVILNEERLPRKVPYPESDLFPCLLYLIMIFRKRNTLLVFILQFKLKKTTTWLPKIYLRVQVFVTVRVHFTCHHMISSKRVWILLSFSFGLSALWSLMVPERSVGY